MVTIIRREDNDKKNNVFTKLKQINGVNEFPNLILNY